MQGLSLVAASGGHSSSRCAGLSLSRPLLLQSTGSRGAGSVVVAHGPSCSAACEIFPDQGWNPCSLHWQADSQPLRHQGSPTPARSRCSFELGCQAHRLPQERWVWKTLSLLIPTPRPHVHSLSLQSREFPYSFTRKLYSEHEQRFQEPLTFH